MQLFQLNSFRLLSHVQLDEICFEFYFFKMTKNNKEQSKDLDQDTTLMTKLRMLLNHMALARTSSWLGLDYIDE